MATTGFNPDEIRSSIASVNSAYKDAVTAMGTNMQSQVIDEMATKWASQEAIDTFNAFGETVNGILQATYDKCLEIVNAMNSAGTAWAIENQESYSESSFDGALQTVDTSGFRKEINGVIGVDVSAALDVVGVISSLAAEASSALENVKSAVTNCGFYDDGGAQQAALNSSVSIIQTNLDNLNIETADAMKKKLESKANSAEDMKGKVSAAFGG